MPYWKWGNSHLSVFVKLIPIKIWYWYYYELQNSNLISMVSRMNRRSLWYFKCVHRRIFHIIHVKLCWLYTMNNHVCKIPDILLIISTTLLTNKLSHIIHELVRHIIIHIIARYREDMTAFWCHYSFFWSFKCLHAFQPFAYKNIWLSLHEKYHFTFTSSGYRLYVELIDSINKLKV